MIDVAGLSDWLRGAAGMAQVMVRDADGVLRPAQPVWVDVDGVLVIEIRPVSE